MKSKHALERQLRETTLASGATGFLRFCDVYLADIAGLWQRAQDDQRRRVQTLLFNNGLLYSGKAKKFEPAESTLFNVLERMNPANLRLASPTGFEPVLPP